MANNVVTITDEDFDREVLNSKLPVLVDFWADWCGPCHLLAPVVEQIAAEQTGKLRVAKLNVDDSPHMAQHFGVLSIPTLILFSGGQERGRVIGARAKDDIARELLGELAA